MDLKDKEKVVKVIGDAEKALPSWKKTFVLLKHKEKHRQKRTSSYSTALNAHLTS